MSSPCNFFKAYPFALTKAASDSTSKLSIELISIDNAPAFGTVRVALFFFFIASARFRQRVLFATCTEVDFDI